MAFFQWSESMSVGIEELDTQHQKLVELVNTLFEAMRMGKARQVLVDVLKELIDYTYYHFETEEQKMKEYGYPNYVSHVAEHERLVKEVSALYERFQKGDVFLSVDTLNFLKNWVTNHILQTDMAYKPFFQSKGIR